MSLKPTAEASMKELRPGAGGFAREEVALRQFKLTDLPSAMDRLGWTQGPRFMRRWFGGAAYALPADYKSGKRPASELPKDHVLSDLPFSWLRTASSRVARRLDEAVADLARVEDYSETVGKTKSGILDGLSPGLFTLLERLDKRNLIDRAKKRFVDGHADFTSLPAMALDETSQFNLITIGTSLWEKATDDFDDVYGALGAFAVKIAALDVETYADRGGFAWLVVNEIGLYVRDTYDFNNDGGDQLLGYWCDDGVRRPGPVAYVRGSPHLDADGKRWFRVSNQSFAEYRQRYGKGADFMVYSTVERHPVDIVIRLSTLDFDELFTRQRG